MVYAGGAAPEHNNSSWAVDGFTWHLPTLGCQTIDALRGFHVIYAQERSSSSGSRHSGRYTNNSSKLMYYLGLGMSSSQLQCPKYTVAITDHMGLSATSLWGPLQMACGPYGLKLFFFSVFSATWSNQPGASATWFLFRCHVFRSNLWLYPASTLSFHWSALLPGSDLSI